jgi:hypothetical protein
MAITLGSNSVIHPTEPKDAFRTRSDLIEECNRLLKSLDNGSYTISWNGILPGEKNQMKYLRARKIGIKIDSVIQYGKFIHPWKPYVVKKIRIEGKDLTWVKSWKTQQIAELVSCIKSLS